MNSHKNTHATGNVAAGKRTHEITDSFGYVHRVRKMRTAASFSLPVYHEWTGANWRPIHADTLAEARDELERELKEEL